MGRGVPMMLTFLAACSWRGPMAMQATSAVGESDNVVSMDRAAYKLVAQSARQAVREQDGRLTVTLELENLSSKEVPLQIQTVFRNKDGMLMGDETNWQMLVLPGNGTSQYTVTSFGPLAETFVVRAKTP